MKVAALFLVAALSIGSSACTSAQKVRVSSTDPSLIAVQPEKPVGYPSTRIDKDDMGNCTKVIDDYLPGLTVQGHKTWRKVTEKVSLGQNCQSG